MTQVRKRLTYANVMSSLAVFLVLGGGAAVAAKTVLPKNSVGAKQLKRNAVATPKIRNDAVTTAKIRDGAVTGAKLNLGTIGTVPRAASAEKAGHADTAGSAATVGGQTIRKLFYASPTSGNATELASLHGLTLKGRCLAGVPELLAENTVGTASIHAGVTFRDFLNKPDVAYTDSDALKAGEAIDLLQLTTRDNIVGTFTYARADGTVVSGQFMAEEEDAFAVRCVITGHIIG